MDLTLTALELGRIQFAFTVSVHIIFPAASIGLACFLAMLECKWLCSQNPIYNAGFLGIMLCGWGRVNPKAHFLLPSWLQSAPVFPCFG